MPRCYGNDRTVLGTGSVSDHPRTVPGRLLAPVGPVTSAENDVTGGTSAGRERRLNGPPVYGDLMQGFMGQWSANGARFTM